MDIGICEGMYLEVKETVFNFCTVLNAAIPGEYANSLFSFNYTSCYTPVQHAVESSLVQQ